MPNKVIRPTVSGARIETIETEAKVTRQQAYQARHKAAGLCFYCPRKAVRGVRCQVHIKKKNAYYDTVQRVKNGALMRYKTKRNKRQFGKILPVAT